MVNLAGMHDGLRELDPQPLSRPELYDRIADLERLRSRVDERLMAHKATLDSLGDTGADSAVVGRSVGRRSERQAKKDMVTAHRGNRGDPRRRRRRQPYRAASPPEQHQLTT